MKVLHFSDSHLGYTDLDKIGQNGVNLREQDFYDAFEYVIDQAIDLKPDVIVHSGDFFHRPSPANRPMIFALDQLRRLNDANIPIVVIAGNHETPKTIYTSPILKAFRNIPGVYPIFNQAYETVEIGDLVVHGLPHINDLKVQLEEMDKIKVVNGKKNIIMLHTSIGRSYIMEEYGEQLFPPDRMNLLDQFDYVALGHWHNFKKVSSLKTAWYSGSTERLSDTEAGKEKGYCILDFAKKEVEPEFIPIPARPWYKIKIDKCHEKTVEEIEAGLLEAIQAIDIQDAILSIHFNDISPLKSISLSRRRIHEMVPGPVYIGIRRHFIEMNGEGVKHMEKTEKLDKLFELFIKDKVDGEERGQRLLTKARHYFNEIDSGKV